MDSYKIHQSCDDLTLTMMSTIREVNSPFRAAWGFSYPGQGAAPKRVFYWVTFMKFNQLEIYLNSSREIALLQGDHAIAITPDQVDLVVDELFALKAESLMMADEDE